MIIQEIYDDFRNFLYLVWEHLGLPPPTRAQYEIAYFMQHGLETSDTRTDIIEAFRGIGKSYIASAYCLWLLYRDPVDTKILVVSATGSKSKEFVSQVKGILNTMPLLAHLRGGRRDTVDKFDVAGASLSQSYSLKAASITGQITGSRATHIIADDIEIESNSKTEDARASLLRAVAEFEAIKVPGSNFVLYLGTPQTEESIYNTLVKERGYTCFCVPARYPKEDKQSSYVLQTEDGRYVNILAPFIQRDLEENPKIRGNPTDPARFNDEELASREAKGRAFFALQYMLDTSLSDAERYPLKLHDLIVMHVNPHKAPMTIQWGKDTDRGNVRSDLSNYGFSGDYYLGPLFVDSEWREYTSSVLFVDPSGRGADETAWSIIKELNGVFYLCKVGGFNGPVDEAMRMIALDAKAYKVNQILVEPNYGGVMWITAFNPILSQIWPNGCSVMEAEWVNTMKEARIIGTIEPVVNHHRLVIDESVAQDDQWCYQYTHIANERNCLRHDDRIDSTAGALAYMVRAMGMDVDQAAKAIRDAEFDAELEDFIETCTTHGGWRRGRGKRRKDGYRPEVYNSDS